MAPKNICTNCKKRGPCIAICEKQEKFLTADCPKKEPPVKFFSDHTIKYKDYEKQTIELDDYRKIDPAIGIRSAGDSNLDRNFDLGPSFEPTGLVMDTKTRANLSEYTRRCHRKEKNLKRYLFNAFLRCDTEKRIALKAGKQTQVIQKYLARICKCIVKLIILQYEESDQKKMDLPNLILTPLKFKQKFIIQK